MKQTVNRHPDTALPFWERKYSKAIYGLTQPIWCVDRLVHFTVVHVGILCIIGGSVNRYMYLCKGISQTALLLQKHSSLWFRNDSVNSTYLYALYAICFTCNYLSIAKGHWHLFPNCTTLTFHQMTPKGTSPSYVMLQCLSGSV